MLDNTIIRGLELKSTFNNNEIKSKNIRNKVLSAKSKIDFKGEHFNLPIVPPMLSQHFLFTGGIGTGKTNAIFQLVTHITNNMTPNDVMIIFDSKGDFYKKFSPQKPNNSFLLSNGPETDFYWNVFNESLIDAYDRKTGIIDDIVLKEDLMELSNNLFSSAMDKNGNNPFFPIAAKNSFFAIMLALYKLGKGNPNYKINNKVIREYTNLPVLDLVQLFLNDSCKDELRQMVDYFGKINMSGDFELMDQGASVMATLRNTMLDLFRGNFAKEGKFSIRNFIRNKGGNTLFIDYDLNQGKLLSPIYKTLMDLAIKESLCRNRTKGNVFFVIDEFRLVPKLDYMDSGVNLGRSLGAKFIVGIQNLLQIDAIYGKEEGRSILSGFISSINFRTTDYETRDYIKSLFGEQIYSYQIVSQQGGTQRDKKMVVTDDDILKLNIGEAIVSVPILTKNPIKFQFLEFQEFLRKL